MASGQNIIFKFSDVLAGIVAGLALGIALTRWWPELTDTNPWWWIIFAVLILIRAFYKLLRFGR